MSHNTKATIKSVFTIALGAASIIIYGGMVNDFVGESIESYFEK